MKDKWKKLCWIIADNEWRKNVVGVKRIMDQIISVKVIVRFRS